MSPVCRKSLLLLVFCISLVTAGSMRAAVPDGSLWRFIHPNAKALVGIQWSKVEKSEVGRWIQQRWLTDESVPGLEFLPDIQEVLISSPGPAAGTANSEPPLLIAIRGKFDLPKVQQLLIRLGYKPHTFGIATIFRPGSKASADPSFAILSTEIILVGDLPSLYATIERSRLPVSDEDKDGLLGRAQLLSTRYDCWALMSEPGAMKNFLFASLAGKTLSADSLGFEAGITVKDGLSIDVVLSSKNDRAARTTFAKLNHLVKQTATATGPPEYAALFQKLKISCERSNVFLTLKMNPREIAASLKVPVAPVVVASHVAGDKVIRIEGLDEGTREVLVRPR